MENIVRPIRTYLSQKPQPRGTTAVTLVLSLMLMASQARWQNWGGAGDLWSAQGKALIEQREWWRLFTAIFVHADMEHLLSNAFMVTILGFFVAAYYSWWVFPTAAVLGAALVNALTILNYPADVSLLGASGLAYLLAGCWLTLYVAIATHLSPLKRSLRAVGMLLGTLFPSTFKPEVSYRSHFYGLIVGIAIGLTWYYLNRVAFKAHEVLPEPEVDDTADLETSEIPTDSLREPREPFDH